MACMAGKKKVLMILTSTCAGISTVLLVLSVASEYWLHSTERFKGSTESLHFISRNFTGPIYVSSHFGLWRACHQYQDKEGTVLRAEQCRNIEFTDVDASQKEEESTTNDIIINCRKTTIFPLLSIFLEISGDICCLLGCCFGKRRYLVFLTGVLFVMSGMSLLAGCILFMGAVTGDANHQEQVAKDEIPNFDYHYGSSFIMVAMSFCFDEISGVLSVYLFIIRHKESVKRRHAELTANKSKADQIQNYFKRKRQQSGSSNGDISRRSSNIPPVSQENSPCFIGRDQSHITLMTTIESNHHLNNSSEDLKLPKLNNHSESHKSENSPLMALSILPPAEFQNNSEPASLTKNFKYKTTTV